VATPQRYRRELKPRPAVCEHQQLATQNDGGFAGWRTPSGLRNPAEYVWIINTSGEVVYKADWTDARAIGAAITRLLPTLTGKEGVDLQSPIPPRSSNGDEFMQGLLDVPGPRAGREFIETIEATSDLQGGVAMRQWLADHGNPID
jgi:hypothetical protein